MPDQTTEYARQVVSGEIVAGPYRRMAAKRHLADLEREDLYFDTAEAERAFRFASLLKVATGSGLIPFEMFGWIKFVVGSTLGWKWAATGLRRFRKVYVEMGRASAKSVILAFIAMWIYLTERKTEPDIYFVSYTEDQAGLAFGDCARFIENSPELSRLLNIYGGTSRNRKRIVFKGATTMGGSRYQIQQAAAHKAGANLSGGRPHVVLMDEYHLFPPGESELMQQVESTLEKRENSLLMIATNSGPNSAVPCWDEHMAGVRMLERATGADLDEGEEGKNDDSLFAYIGSLDPGDDYLDEAVWAKTNPAVGVTPTHETMRKVIVEGKRSPSALTHMRRYRFCEWIDPMSPFIETHYWEAAQIKPSEWPSAEELADLECVGGVDLGQKRDLTSKVLIYFDPSGKGPIYIRNMNWTPRNTMRWRQASEGTDYLEMARLGFIAGTGKNATDWGMTAKWIAERHGEHPVSGIAADAWRIESLLVLLKEQGLTLSSLPGRRGILVASHPNGWAPFGGHMDKSQGRPKLWMSESIQVMEEALVDGKAKILYNPFLTKAVNSAQVIEDGKGNRCFKKMPGQVRTDPLMAMIYAAGMMDFYRKRAVSSGRSLKGLDAFYGATGAEFTGGGVRADN